MEIGEYLTNVLSSSNFASISYEYLESQSLSLEINRKNLQKAEAAWREEGALIHYDQFRDGIWRFRPGSTSDTAVECLETASLLRQNLSIKEKGIYEPSVLARAGIFGPNSFPTPGSSSPSSFFEGTVRNAQGFASRAAQSNGSPSIHEPAVSPFGNRPGPSAPSSPSFLKGIHECFISAVLESIVFNLCRDHAFLPLNSRTLIFASSVPGIPAAVCGKLSCPEGPITLVTLDISLTSLGILVIKACSDTAHGLQSLLGKTTLDQLSAQPPGTHLWLAPIGNAAKFCGVYDENNSANTPMSNAQRGSSDPPQRGFSGATMKSWQVKCLEWLEAKGLDTTGLEESSWILVQILKYGPSQLKTEFAYVPTMDELPILPWPASLCFRATGAGKNDMESSFLTICDPLRFVEEWFRSDGERSEIISRRQKERQVVEASKEKATTEARSAVGRNFSAAVLRRGSNSGAMYPTPPDAVHQPVGATPTFDGMGSTPGNANPVFTNESDMTVAVNQMTQVNEAERWPSSDKKSLSTSNFNENDNDNDNLFEDIGGDLFGDTDITDADFNFFDQPDMLPGDQQADLFERMSEHTMPLSSQRDPAQNVPLTSQSQRGDLSIERPTSSIDQDMETDSPMPPPLTKPVEATSPTSTPITQPNVPFTKETIFERLLTGDSKGPQTLSVIPRRESVFNKIDFAASLTSIDGKYRSTGRFGYAESEKPGPQNPANAMPTTDYLGRRRKRILGGVCETHPLLISNEPLSDLEPIDNNDLEFSHSDASSQTSEQDDASPPASILGTKRKWLSDNEIGDGMSCSFNGTGVDNETTACTPQSVIGGQLPILDTDPAEWSLATYVTTPEPDARLCALSDVETIGTAQILADQAISGTFRLPGSRDHGDTGHLFGASSTSKLMSGITRAAVGCLPEVTRCNLRSFLDIQGISVPGQSLRLPPRPLQNPKVGQADNAKPSNITRIDPPQLELQRADAKLTIQPPAVHFWDNLGLGPFNGGKDILAVCLYPDLEGMAENADTFLDQMSRIYESSRLGNHGRVVAQDCPEGTLPFSLSSKQDVANGQSLAKLKETANQLSKLLSAVSAKEKNLVVYFVYPEESATIVVHICSAFKHLFNIYSKALSDRKESATNELVLQLVPFSFIFDPMSLVVPLSTDYFHLGMEVYDRCIDCVTSSSTAAILLEQPLPRTIDFKLNANPSPSLLQENTCLHLAYALSIDERWITAAWTDNRGTEQMTASYCLGRKGEPISMPFSDIANEIWATTLGLVSSKKIHWRIFVARSGVMDPAEVEIWTALGTVETNAHISLTLITTQNDPSLRLLSSPTILLQSNISPVSTPQDPPTPNQTGGAATTTEESDADARLIDYTDQSWCAIAAHRLNNSNSLLEINPALISGYLVRSADPPIVLEINIIYSEVTGNPRTFHESLLREIIGYYRGLATLARVRGKIGKDDGRPWHIAAAEMAVKTLYALM